MNSTRETNWKRAGLAGSVAAAVAASICCIGPVLAVLLGLGSLAGLARFEAYRPLFTGVTLAFLAGAFYLTYRKKDEACEPGAVCARHGVEKIGRINRIVLWAVTIIVLAILSFPTWSVWII